MMRQYPLVALVALAGCTRPASRPAPAADAGVAPAADVAHTTRAGNTLLAPGGWTVTERGPATILESPEHDSRIAIVDVGATDADAAVTAAWALYAPPKTWPLKVASNRPDEDGWTKRRFYTYQTAPTEHREVTAEAMSSGSIWTVMLVDASKATAEKRRAAFAQVRERLSPAGYVRESFAGKKANRLDGPRIAALSAWVEESMRALRVPGAALGVIQDGKTVFAGGFGVRELGKKDRPDADTLFLVASNTKALSTLLLAKLVDEKRFTWDTPVSQVLPQFALGDDATTRQTLVKHLVCACTGLPRLDLPWLFEFEKLTPAGALGALAKVQPTTRFGETYQYSNLLAAAGGFVGGHVANPQLELGAAYDAAMQAKVFGPLGMKSTTFDFGKALGTVNHSGGHGIDAEGKAAKAAVEVNAAFRALRPAGGAWSNVRDMLAYLQMELARGKLADGQRYIGEEALLARRAPQVAMSKDETYGMGLEVSTRYGTPIIHHGGDLVGFHSDMYWLPDHDVGLVILLNGDAGTFLRDGIARKLVELLFDARPEADARIASSAKSYFEERAAERRLLAIPPLPAMAAALARHYASDALGDLTVTTTPKATLFDFGEWKSEVATRKDPDGTASFVTIVPGMSGYTFVPGGATKRTLTLRDAQHEYVFTEN